MSFIDKIRDKLYGFTPAYGEMSAQCERPLKSSFPRGILFVCSGNICRSPYGAAFCHQLIASRHADTRIVSAGTLQIFGRCAAPEMADVAMHRGIDLRAHRSQGVSKTLVDAAELIFCMEKKHYQFIAQMSLQAKSKMEMLGMYLSDPRPEIDDPMGRPMEAYETAALQIEEALRRWYDHVV